MSKILIPLFRFILIIFVFAFGYKIGNYDGQKVMPNTCYKNIYKTHTSSVQPEICWFAETCNGDKHMLDCQFIFPHIIDNKLGSSTLFIE